MLVNWKRAPLGNHPPGTDNETDVLPDSLVGIHRQATRFRRGYLDQVALDQPFHERLAREDLATEIQGNCSIGAITDVERRIFRRRG